jgi:amino acid adenylation domain-containing protein
MASSEIVESYDLSSLQAGILYHSGGGGSDGVYVVRLHYRIASSIDVDAFRGAWQDLIDRHPILRTSFAPDELGRPRQRVHAAAALPFELEDWSSDPKPERERRLADRLTSEGARDFDLSAAPLLRILLIRWSEDTHHLVLCHHHILIDGWSRPVLFGELERLYAARTGGVALELPVPRPYRDYVDWLGNQDLAPAEAYWREALRGFSAPTPLGVDRRSSDEIDGERYAKQSERLPDALADRLQRFARQHRLTANTLFQGAWSLLLSRYGREDDVAFGAVTIARPPELGDFDHTLGLFINTIPVRTRVPGDANVVDWLRGLQLDQVEAREHASAPLAAIQQWSDVPAGTPLFHTLLAFENFPGGAGDEASLDLELVEVRDWTNYPLTLEVETDGGLTLTILYDRLRLTHPIVERMLGHVRTLLGDMADRPDARLRELRMLSGAERRKVLVEWNDTDREYPFDPLLHRLVEDRVRREPEADAVVCEGARLSFAELDRRANALAHRLRSRGVDRDVLVGVCMDRSIELVVALLAVLKAGGAYVPLVPDYPADRLAFMIEDAQPPVVLTQRRFAEILPGDARDVVCLDEPLPDVVADDAAPPATEVAPDDLAYVIYTSGTTGRPKGTMVSHRAICNRIFWMQEEHGLVSDDRVLQKTPIGFDVSVWEFFWPLVSGATLVVARPGLHRDGRGLARLIRDEAVTTIHFVPSMLQIFLEQPDLETCTSLRRVFCSGEALAKDLQDRFLTRSTAELHNLYGPTEAAIDVTRWACRRDDTTDTVPIGKPVPNTRIYLLDERNEPVPIGVAGELHIGGVQVARGYWRREDLTAERFIEDPFGEPGARLYRTGDLARHLPDGSLEFLGRNDAQVKIRGMRVELAEIEHHVDQHPRVGESVVSYRRFGTGDHRLVAYVVPAADGGDRGGELVAALKASLRDVLPDYMVPAYVTILTALPLSPNGKVDRAALPEPEEIRREEPRDGAASLTKTEAVIADVWCELLELDEVHPEDNFFDLGGHSLLAMQVANRLERAADIQLHPNHLVYQTLRQVAALCDDGGGAAEPHEALESAR